MVHKRKLKLTNHFIKVLENMPEQGMGYHLVDIEMFDGSLLRKKIIINSTFLQVEANEEIDIKKIKSIKQHHKK